MGVILSMFTDPGTVSEGIKAGADGYLSTERERRVGHSSDS